MRSASRTLSQKPRLSKRSVREIIVELLQAGLVGQNAACPRGLPIYRQLPEGISNKSI